MKYPDCCIAGRNQAGTWFIACADTQSAAVQLLADNHFDQHQSSVQNETYDSAARHVRRNGGTSWATNAIEVYVTVAGIPREDICS